MNVLLWNMSYLIFVDKDKMMKEKSLPNKITIVFTQKKLSAQQELLN